MNKIITIPVILGQTATGKTAAGIHLAAEINGEIISMDSRKVYQGLPIGTATPEGILKDGAYWVHDIPHHLMAFRHPMDPYTAGDFVKDALALMQEILNRGKIPILVGGTGFYFKALAQGLPPLPKRDVSFRAELTQKIKKEGPAVLHAELAQKDPDAAAKIYAQDGHKIIRALEIIHLTGEPYSTWKTKGVKPAPYQYAVFGLGISKEEGDEKIIRRSKKMLEKGMIEETDQALKNGISPDCPILSSFGYKEAVDVISGKITREMFLERLIAGTRAYAKRQRTWFRTQIKPFWIDAPAQTPATEISLNMRAFLKNPPDNLLYSGE